MKLRIRQKLSSVIAVGGLVLVAVALAAPGAFAQRYNNGLAAKPAMGWSSWSAIRSAVSDPLIRAQADAMHAQLQSHGYQYINVDDGWYVDSSVSCDQYGRLLPDPKKFPNGIKAVADYVHSLGLKFGIYEKPDIPKAAVLQNCPILGTSYHAQDIIVQPATVPWPAPQLDLGIYEINWNSPGAQAYINSCAAQLASWGVDYVKLDWVNATINLNTDLPAWGTALKTCGRPIYFSISNYLQVQPPYGPQIVANANGWRNNPDVETYNPNGLNGFSLPITDWYHVTAATRMANLQQQQETVLGAPGGWNDMDSLELGWGPVNGGLAPNEKPTMFSMWAMGTSPLLIGSDLTQMDQADLAMLQNDEVIACDQAPYEPSYTHMTHNTAQLYWKPSGDGGYYVFMVNMADPGSGSDPDTITCDFAGNLGLSGAQTVRDLFQRTTLGSMTSITEVLHGRSSVLLKVGGTTPTPPNAVSGLTATPGNGQVVLAWSVLAGAGSYNVYRDGAKIATGVAQNGYTDSGLMNGTVYTYQATGNVNSVEGPPSAPAQTVPQGQVMPYNGVYYIVNQGSTYALDDPAGGGVATKIDQAASGGVNQQWTITSIGGGYYSVKSAGGFAVGAPTPNTQLVLETATGADEQTWSFWTNGNYILIKNKANNLVFDVAGATEGNIGGVVDTWGANGGTNQNWSLNPLNVVKIPPPPTGLTGTAISGSVTLTWNSVSSASSYNLYRSTTSGTETLIVSGIKTPTYTDTSLTNGIRYYYQVTSVNPQGMSALSTEFSIVPNPPVTPNPPSGLVASPGNAQVTLTWQPDLQTGSQNNGASTYNVYRGATSGSESATPIATGVTATSFVDSGLTNGATYYYYIKGVNPAGASSPSNEASATPVLPPAAPSGLSTVAGNAQVSLSWTAATRATSYNIYRGTSSGGEALIVSGVTSTTYTDTTVNNFVTYYYQVTAVNAGGESPKSSETAATPAVISAVPTGLAAGGTAGAVLLSWTPSIGATSYNVYRGTSSGAEQLSANVTGNGFTDTTVSTGVTYYYKVSAVNSAGVSGLSNEASAASTTNTSGLTLTGTPGFAQVVLNWNAFPNASYYEIFRGTTVGGEDTNNPFFFGNGTTYTDTGLKNGTAYFYYVVCITNDNVGHKSNEITVTPGTTVSIPTAPTGLAAVAGNAQVSLTWTATTGATSYNVYRNGAKVNSSSVTGPSYTDTGLTNGTTYTYAVTAVNSAGESPKSATVTATPNVAVPPAPTGLTATPGNAQVGLAWTGSAGATSYNVYRGTSAGGEASTPVASNITGVSYSNTGLTNGTKYYFTVKAVNAGGSSPASNEASSTPTAGTTESPYSGSPVQISATGATTIEAENYDRGGEGVAYHSAYSSNPAGSTYRSPDSVAVYDDSAATNGHGIGWTTGGEWQKYMVNVATAGTYTIAVRVASTSAVSGAMHVSDTGGPNLTGSINVPNTGAWTTYQATVTANVSLTAGAHTLQLMIDTGGYNIDSIVIGVPLSAGTKFNQGQYLTVGQYIASPSKNCFLVQQSDGNLCLYKGADPNHNQGFLWGSLSASQPTGSYFTILQTDGNLVTYKGTGPSNNLGYVWANFTSGSNYLQITDSQQIQMISGSTVQWQKP